MVSAGSCCPWLPSNESYFLPYQVMDYGYPQFTEAQILAEYIKTDAYKMEVRALRAGHQAPFQHALPSAQLCSTAFCHTSLAGTCHKALQRPAFSLA